MKIISGILFGCVDNKIIDDKVMFGSSIGIRYVKLTKEDPYMELISGLGIMNESSVYFKVSKKTKGLFH